MTVPVPKAFAESLRNQRLYVLSALSIVCFLLGIFCYPGFAYAGLPLIGYIVIILMTYKLPLMYKVGARGIYLTTQNPYLALPISLATNFWCAWFFDRVIEVGHTHWRSTPALLIHTRFNQRGALIPVQRKDAEPVAIFLCPTSSPESGANAFS